MIKVLFVCLGNICRSPLAEAIFKAEVKKRGMEHLLQMDSAGTAGYHIGDAPDPRSYRNALQNGISIDHRGRQFQFNDFQDFDYILAMDQSNLRHITQMAKQQGIEHSNIYLMRSFQVDPDSQEVPDPYYGGHQGFQEVFDILSDANRRFLAYLKGQHQW